MAFRRHTKRSFKKKRSFKRRPFKRSFKRSFKKKGFVKSYKRDANVGRYTPKYKKFFSQLANRRFLALWNINYTNTGPTTDRSLIYMPMANLIQATGINLGAVPSQPVLPMGTFNGDQVFLRGIMLNFFVAPTLSTDVYIRVMCFWAKNDLYMIEQFPGVITTFTDTGSAANTVSVKDNDSFRFLDLAYGMAGGYPDTLDQTTRPNPNYPGKLLFDKKIKLTARAGVNTAETNGGTPTSFQKLYFPFNKRFEWSSYPFSTDIAAAGANNLAAPPNFGKYGQPVFVIYQLDGPSIGAGNPSQIDYVGECMIYFKDLDT